MPKKGRPVEEDHRARLRDSINSNGLENVATETGVAEQTLARVVAGLDVYGGTRGAIRAYLEREHLMPLAAPKASPAPVPAQTRALLIGPKNCEQAVGLPWRAVLGYALEIGVKPVHVGRALAIPADEFVAAVKKAAAPDSLVSFLRPFDA